MMDIKHFLFHDQHGTTYEPWSDGVAVGFKVTRAANGLVEYVYLNPSGEDSDGQPNVFFYQGNKGDPGEDIAVCYQNLFV